jgi:hypothetical protein
VHCSELKNSGAENRHTLRAGVHVCSANPAFEVCVKGNALPTLGNCRRELAGFLAMLANGRAKRRAVHSCTIEQDRAYFPSRLWRAVEM